MNPFEAFQLDPLVLDALRQMGYETPTPVQEKTIPLVMEGKDVIALAETGSGKTAACAIPLCHKIDVQSTHVQGLIIVPTRELALQYATEAQKIGKFKKVKAFALYGGEDMGIQLSKLKAGVQLLIATPGRLIDLIFSRSINLNHVHTIVFDEADQMLGMGFIEDLEFILQCLVHEHQTLLFSATMPDQIQKIGKTHMKHPVELRLISDKPTPKNLAHHFRYCPNPSRRKEELLALLEKYQPKQCIIFANSRREVEELTRAFKKKLDSIEFLHGGLDQGVRTTITAKFARGKIRYLLATDVASRGLDFSHVTHVFNYHLPIEDETYLHRSGRAGRSGREGTCVTLVTKHDLGKLNRIAQMMQKEPEWIGKPPERS